MTSKRNTRKSTAGKTRNIEAVEMVEQNDDATIAALMEEVESEVEASDDELLAEFADADEIVEDLEAADDVSEEDESTAAHALEIEDAVAAIEDDDEDSTPIASEEEVAEKTVKPKVKRASTGSKPSAQFFERKLNEDLVLNVEAAAGDIHEHHKQIAEKLDNMAIKVGEKAINLLAFVKGAAKLSVYTEIAVKRLMSAEKEGKKLTAGELVAHMMNQDENGVKGYSEGTARSQSYQMFKLLPELDVCDDGKEGMTFNEDSPVAAFLKTYFDDAK